MAKDKLSFSIDGIKYTDIKGTLNASNIYISVAGTAQMIRQWMKEKYPQFSGKDYYSIKSRSYANGDSIDVYLNEAPEDIYKEINSELNDKFENQSYHYGAFQGGRGKKNKTDEGELIAYGTKYLFAYNKNRFDSNPPTVDWSLTATKKSTSKPALNKPTSSTTTSASSANSGDLLKECSGWLIYKKTLNDGRIVYNAKIKPTTPSNKSDWSAIKGEIYTQTGFKWGKFQAFEKWGVIASENVVIDNLCSILDKYYKDPTAPSQSLPIVTPQTLPTAQPQQNTSLNESYKSLPANPKLEYCAITQAEGSYPLGTFPIRFQSFTALTKFIADNITDMPKKGEGYDKYFIKYNWKFAGVNDYLRVDVSEGDANPYIYSNLYIFNVFQNICYDAWQRGGMDEKLYEASDIRYSELGREGLEMNSMDFLKLLNSLIDYFPQESKRFDYNTLTERRERFASVYPKIYALFAQNTTTTTQSKEDIEKIIRGLEVLVRLGNIDAEKKIKGYRVILKTIK